MFIEAEDGRASLAFIAADPFECGEPIVKTVGKDMDLGILPGNKPSRWKYNLISFNRFLIYS